MPEQCRNVGGTRLGRRRRGGGGTWQRTVGGNLRVLRKIVIELGIINHGLLCCGGWVSGQNCLHGCNQRKTAVAVGVGRRGGDDELGRGHGQKMMLGPAQCREQTPSAPYLCMRM